MTLNTDMNCLASARRALAFSFCTHQGEHKGSAACGLPLCLGFVFGQGVSPRPTVKVYGNACAQAVSLAMGRSGACRPSAACVLQPACAAASAEAAKTCVETRASARRVQVQPLLRLGCIPGV